jgi:transposase
MTPEVWAEIRRLILVEKLSQREVCLRVGLNRRTVKRALRQPHAPTAPSRDRPSMLDRFEKDIREILEKTPGMTGVRLLEELQRRGFQGKITVLRDYLRAMREKRQNEAFVRRIFHPGEAVEVDWAKCGSIEIAGVKRRLSVFVMVLCYSRMLYLEFTVSEVMEEFLRCHQNAFTFFQGCARKGIYDNLRSVVLTRHGSDIRWNPRFMDFAGYYLFEPVACNPAAGWEKGRVERTIQYIRTSFLPGRDIRSLEGINAEAREWRDRTANVRIHKTTGRRPVDLFADDRARLLALPDAPYDTRVLRSVRVTSDCRVTFENNTYSVPPKYVGEWATLRASPAEVWVYHGPDLIAQHRRRFGTHEDVLDPAHATALLARKRRAASSTQQRLFLAMGPEAEPYLAGLVRSERSVDHHLRRILDLAATYGHPEVQAAITRAQQFGAFGADYVENILLADRRQRREEQKTPLQISRSDLAEIDLPEQDLGRYDSLMDPPANGQGEKT